MRVLIADDDRDSVDAYVLFMEGSGIDVDAAYDGATALEIASRQLPDVAVLDLGMPGMNGLELCRRLRELDPARRMKIVALTGWGMPDHRELTADAGFDEHWTKPLSPVLLVRLVLSCVDEAVLPRRETLSATTTDETAGGSDAILRPYLARIKNTFHIDVVFVSQFKEGHRVVRVACADPDDDRAVREGDSDPLEETYCYRIADRRAPALISDVKLHEAVLPAGATQRYAIGAYLALPVVTEDGRILGTVCCLNHSPGDELASSELMESLKSVASIAASLLVGMERGRSGSSG